MADENNNNEETALTPEELQAKHEAEKAELHSNYEKGVQKVLKEKKEKEFMLDAYDKLVADKKAIIELEESNPELTQQVLDKFFNGATIDEVKSQLDGADKPAIDVKKEISKGIEQAKITDKIDSFITKAGLEGEEKEKFLEQLEENTPKKGLSLDNLDKVLKHSFIDVNPDIEKLKDLDNKVKIANAMAVGGQKQSDSKTKDTDAITKQVQESIKRSRIYTN